ncbi:MFS transporter [Micrococcus sp.]|uniref:MFS transporter n=1 Tax=Micrococcus sp. TaxID=1271 RepID=UPI002A90EB43|nr:MFS transporter [Micrococcus sp.]MDY6055091.1 MFS transporter [Micrococcus sp.]
MDFGAYARLLQDKRIRHLLAVGFIARFPHTAAGVILTLHVALTLELGYGQAGLAAAAMTLGIAVGSPWRGRTIDRRGLRRALLPSVVAESLLWPVVPWLPFPWMLAAVFVAGVFAVPIFSVVRQGLGVLTRGPERQTAFALDSIITELIFMVGPASGAVVAATWSTALGLTIVGLSGGLGGALLMWFNPPTRSSQLASDPDPYTEAEDRDQALAQAVHAAPMHVERTAPELATGALPVVTEALPLVTGALPVVSLDDSGRAVAPGRESDRPEASAGGAGGAGAGSAGDGGAGAAASGGPVGAVPSELTRAERWALWRERHFGWVGPEVLGVFVVSLAAGLTLVGTEVTIVAQLERADQAASVGVVYALWCGASAVGGLFYGAWGRQVHPYLLMSLFALATLPMAFVGDGVWALAVASIPAGLLTAPTLAATSARISVLVVEERRGEAMGYYGSAMTAGSALGAPSVGIVIDAVAPAAGYVFAVAAGLALVALAAAVTFLRRRRAAR